MPPLTNDLELAEGLDAIREATLDNTIQWGRLLHPIDGSLMAFKGVGQEVQDCTGEGPASWVYLLDDDYVDFNNPDIEDGPSIARYASDADMYFDAMVLAKFSCPKVQDSLAKLLRLVRKVAR